MASRLGGRRRCEESEKGSHFALSSTWKNGKRRHFSDNIAYCCFVLVRGAIILGVFDFLDCGAADNCRSHLLIAGFCGSLGDVVAQLSGHRVQLVQRVVHANPSIAPLRSIRVVATRAQWTRVFPRAHWSWHKGGHNSPKTSLLLISPANSVRVFAVADISPRIPLDNFPCFQQTRLWIFCEPCPRC
jgi:hypothetical protein